MSLSNPAAQPLAKSGIHVPADYWPKMVEKETKIVLPEPIRVSPLIRFARYTALFAGIAYGAYRFNYYCKWHAEVREKHFEEKFAKKVEEARQKKYIEQEQLRDIFKQVGLEFTEGIAAFGVYDTFRPK